MKCGCHTHVPTVGEYQFLRDQESQAGAFDSLGREKRVLVA